MKNDKVNIIILWLCWKLSFEENGTTELFYLITEINLDTSKFMKHYVNILVSYCWVLVNRSVLTIFNHLLRLFVLFCFLVSVYGVEYAFGAHDFPSSGVFEVEPRQCPGFKFRKSILIGTTRLDPLQLRQFMELQSLNYNGDSYHLITKNCNHFCKDICFKLTGNSIPKWVNRLARIGNIFFPFSICDCSVPL